MGRQLAAAIKGQAVITTATDVNALFAVDEWAARFGLHLSSLTEAKAFASGLLERGRAGLYSDFPVEGPLPSGLVVTTDCETGLIVTTKAAVSVFPQLSRFGRLFSISASAAPWNLILGY